MAAKDQRCSTRREDWRRWLRACIGRYDANEKRRHDKPVLNYLLTVGHTGKNILVEEWRRMTGKCPKGD